ncbi:MAG: hypothetical protein HY659_10140 [Rhizobiales bacterium]|nr:hypothetical protein [Hyphomicrobiales bacterium]
MNNLSSSLALLSVFALPAIGHSFFISPKGHCFTAGSATYQLTPTAATPDYRIRIDNAIKAPDLRMQLVDRPEIADIVIADDFHPSDGDLCKAAGRLKKIRIGADEPNPDVTVAFTQTASNADYKLFVHSARFSHHDAAALMAVMWKAAKRREFADRR